MTYLFHRFFASFIRVIFFFRFCFTKVFLSIDKHLARDNRLLKFFDYYLITRNFFVIFFFLAHVDVFIRIFYDI